MMPPPPAMASIKDARNTPAQISRMIHRGKPFTVKSVNRENTLSSMKIRPPKGCDKIQLIVTDSMVKINMGQGEVKN